MDCCWHFADLADPPYVLFAPTAVIRRTSLVVALRHVDRLSRQGKTGNGAYLMSDEHLSEHQTAIRGRSEASTPRQGGRGSSDAAQTIE